MEHTTMMSDGPYYVELNDANYSIGETVISWRTIFTTFPFDEVFNQNTTYYTARADAYFFTDPNNIFTTPIYMDGLEFIPDWLLSRNYDDEDEFDEFFSDVTFNLFFTLTAVVILPTYKKYRF